MRDWEGNRANYKMESSDNLVYPNVVKENGRWTDFTRPPYSPDAGYENAMRTGNYVEMPSERDAIWFGKNYKYIPEFRNESFEPKFDKGGEPSMIERWKDRRESDNVLDLRDLPPVTSSPVEEAFLSLPALWIAAAFGEENIPDFLKTQRMRNVDEAYRREKEMNKGTDKKTVFPGYFPGEMHGNLNFEDGGPVFKEFIRKIIDSEARNAPSYENIEFGQAFRDARKNGSNTFYWNGNYYSTNLDKNPFADTAVNYKNSDWTKQMHNDLRTLLQNSNISFTLDDIARVIEEESSYNKFSSKGSYVGPLQFGVDWLTKIYGSNAQNIYNQYKNKTRTDNDIINDIVNYLQKLDDNIKSERDKMTYGRLKVNQYAPNASLDDKISKTVWNNNLKYEIELGRLSKDIKPGESTYRDAMESYDLLLQNRNK